MQPEEQAVVLANVAERAERYDDMAAYMKERVSKGGALSTEERDLFSAAYKGTLSTRRLAVRVASSVEQQEAAEGRTANASLAAGYRSKVEAELHEVCAEVTQLLVHSLLPQAENGEPKAFYLKMQGDYFRYMAEFMTGEARQKAADEARIAYTAATEEASIHLLTTHPVRLGLALNFSVFQHEVLGDTFAAVDTALAALKDAASSLEGMPEESVRDATLTMQLLQENLSLWVPEN
ncbi:unnamed protein product [Polarella glacialis]|uniref:14-3-3 domain-containing protein n=1 Tax=Polarella glacialis TaxID=89957 RepID=A0A813H710_POLGL|nr:unnamed protein product [Polarella glacialis]